MVLFGPPALRATAGDWPQILGPARNGVAIQEKLVAAWPDQGPPTVWQRPLGSGFAGVAVVQPRVVVFHRQGDEEIVQALDASGGKPLWERHFPARYERGTNPDNGPRCVPVIHQGWVYAYGAGGELHCVALETGNIRWSRNLREDYRAPDGFFGAGSSPLVFDDKLLINVGGRGGAGLVALDLETGETKWTSTDEGASYSSPVPANFDGRPQVLFVTRYNLVSVDPRQGQVIFREPFGMRGPTVNGANPLVFGNHIFLSASYRIGAKLLRIHNGQATEAWASDEVMSSQYPTSVHHQGVLYGMHGRQDVGSASLRAVDAVEGKVLWSRNRFGLASLILADQKLIVMKTDGELILAEPSPRAYRELARAQVLTGTTRALPALSEGKLYVRNERELKCLDLSRSD